MDSVGVVGGTVDLFMVLVLLFVIPAMYISLWMKDGQRPLTPVEQQELDAAEESDFHERFREDFKNGLLNTINTSKILLRLTQDPAERHNLKSIIRNAESRLHVHHMMHGESESTNMKDESGIEMSATKAVSVDGMMHSF